MTYDEQELVAELLDEWRSVSQSEIETNSTKIAAELAELAAEYAQWRFRLQLPP